MILLTQPVSSLENRKNDPCTRACLDSKPKWIIIEAERVFLVYKNCIGDRYSVLYHDARLYVLLLPSRQRIQELPNDCHAAPFGLHDEKSLFKLKWGFFYYLIVQSLLPNGYNKIMR